MVYIEYNFYGGLPTLRQKAVGPMSAANIGPTDVLTLGQRRSDGGMLSGTQKIRYYTQKIGHTCSGWKCLSVMFKRNGTEVYN